MVENFTQRKLNLVLLTYDEFPFLFFFFNQRQNFLSMTEAKSHVSTHWRLLQKKIAEENWTKNDGTIAGQLHRDRSQNNQTWDKNGRWYHIQLKQKNKSGYGNIFPFPQKVFSVNGLNPRTHPGVTCNSVIVRVSVVLTRTVVGSGDWRFDNLSGSHH